jgi:hypothetical protein
MSLHQVTISAQTPPTIEVVVSASQAVLFTLPEQGPPGPPGPLRVPDPATVGSNHLLAVVDHEYQLMPMPAGTGDMQSLIYDPSGKTADVFDLSNHTGVLDAGEFTGGI